MDINWDQPTIQQVIVLIGFALATFLCFYFGIRIIRRAIKFKFLEALYVGFGPALILFGIALTFLTLNLATYTLTDFKELNIFARWWFMPYEGGHNWFSSMLASPTMFFLILSVFVLYWGIPTPTKIRAYLSKLKNKETRSETLWTMFYIAIMLIGGTAGAIGAGLITGQSFAAIPGAFIGGFGLFIFVILVQIVFVLIFKKKTPGKNTSLKKKS